MQNNFTEPCSAHISKSKVRLSFITLYVLGGGQTQKDEKKDDERELTAKKRKKERKMYMAGEKTVLRERERESKEKGAKYRGEE